MSLEAALPPVSSSIIPSGTETVLVVEDEEAMRRLNFPEGKLFLPKPFTHHELAWRVREVLDGGGA